MLADSSEVWVNSESELMSLVGFVGKKSEV